MFSTTGISEGEVVQGGRRVSSCVQVAPCVCWQPNAACEVLLRDDSVVVWRTERVSGMKAQLVKWATTMGHF